MKSIYHALLGGETCFFFLSFFLGSCLSNCLNPQNNRPPTIDKNTTPYIVLAKGLIFLAEILNIFMSYLSSSFSLLYSDYCSSFLIAISSSNCLMLCRMCSWPLFSFKEFLDIPTISKVMKIGK